MEIKNIFYTDYNGSIKIDCDALIVALWNYKSSEDNKIYVNDAEFINSTFKSSYEAAYAVSLGKKWAWIDTYAYFDNEGFLVSFSHWDDETCPIDLDKLDVCQLIRGLKDINRQQQEHRMTTPAENISRAIHDALKE